MQNEPARLPALKLIAFGLMAGVVLFTAIAAAMVSSGSAAPSTSPGLFAGLLGLVAVSSLPFAAVMGPMFTGAARKQWPERREQPGAGDWLLNQFAVLTIVRLAVVEAIGLLGAAGLMLTGRWAFIAAPALVVVLMLLVMPTEARARAFITRVTGEVPR